MQVDQFERDGNRQKMGGYASIGQVSIIISSISTRSDLNSFLGLAPTRHIIFVNQYLRNIAYRATYTLL